MLWSENVIIMENTASEESLYHVFMIIQPSSQDLLDKKWLWWWRRYPEVHLRFSEFWFCLVKRHWFNSWYIMFGRKWWVLREFNQHSMCLGAVIFAVVRKNRCVSSFLMECCLEFIWKSPRLYANSNALCVS